MLRCTCFSTLLLCLVLSLPCWAQHDTRPDPSRLVVMTFNAEFLWDGVEPEEGQVDFAWKHSPSEADDHMRAIAEVIIRNNPDIVKFYNSIGVAF